MTINDINELNKKVKDASFIVEKLEKLKEKGIHNNFENENFIMDYHTFKGYGYQKDTVIGDAVLQSLKFDWDIFNIHLENAKKHLNKLRKQLEEVNNFLENIKIKEIK